MANKYYLLFQHHLAPPVSTFTTGEFPDKNASNSVAELTKDAPQTTSQTQTTGPDPRQLENTYVLEEKTIDSSYIIGSKPGVSRRNLPTSISNLLNFVQPYVAEHSRSIYARLGARIAFFGIDARTERTRHQVNYPETYKIISDRLRQELSAAKNSSSQIQHLVVLLGIPIAYPVSFQAS